MSSTLRVSLCRIIVFSAVCFGAEGLVAQLPSETSPAQPSTAASPKPSQAPLRHRTLDVLVTDSSGKPVTHLEPFDLKIYDNQVQQKILAFRRFEMTSDQTQSAEVIFLLDAVNSSYQSMELERQDVAKYLRSNGGKLRQPTSIILLTDTEMKVQPHPSLDGNALAAAIEANPNPVHARPNAAGYAALMERQEYCLRSLSQLAFFETSKPGRKIVIWISHGWPNLAISDTLMQDADLKRVFDSVVLLTNRLVDARITLDMIDPRGPVQGENPLYYRAYLKPPASPNSSRSPQLMLQVLASHSGGHVIDISTDIAAEIGTCLDDLSAWYSLSFDSQPSARTKEFHAIDIKTSQTGLITHTTFGYYD